MKKTMHADAVTIEVQRPSNDPSPDDGDFRQWAQAAVAAAGGADGEITIRVVTEDEIAALNQQYRNKHKPTNVLSFPLDFPAELHTDEFLLPLGDIAICATVVQHEAQQQHKSEQSHWAHMVIHGVLHLLGYDHINDEDAKVMESLEIDILQQMGFANPYQEQ